MTFAQRRNRLTTHFSERIPVVKRSNSVFRLLMTFLRRRIFARQADSKSLRSFSLSGSAEVKYITRSDGINHL